MELGRFLADFFRKVLRENPHLRHLLVSLGSGLVLEDKQREATKELDDLFSPFRQNLAKILLCTDYGPVDNDECDTDIRAEPNKRRASVARDPGVGVCDSLTLAANARMSADPQGIDGIFPHADEGIYEDFESEENVATHNASELDTESLKQFEESACAEVRFRLHRFTILRYFQRKQGKSIRRLYWTLKIGHISSH